MNILRQVNTIGWDRLRTFYHVAKVGKFTAAAELLNLNQSSLSRTILNLEERLKCQLFIRSIRGITLTEQGEILYNACEKIFSEIESALTKLDKEEGTPQGSIRIRATGGLVNFFLLKYIPGFLKLYPDISLTIIADDSIPEFDFSNIDVAIRPSVPEQENIVQRHLLTNHIRLYASKEYLKKFGTPKDVSDLDHHQLIGFGDHTTAHDFQHLNWHLSVGMKPGHLRTPFINVNTPLGRIQLASLNLGIAAISKEHPGLQDYDFTEVLPDLLGKKIDSYYIYPVQLKNSKRIQVLGDYLEEQFKKEFK